jgi:AcrR family transcriptional regulator
MTKADRRVQRTRDLLQKALIELMRERAFEAVTIQDIVDRANVGRTTFYLHYGSKDDLLMSCHEVMVSELHFGPLYPLSREALLAPEAPPGMISAFRHLYHAGGLLDSIFQGKESLLILRRLRDWNADAIEASLHAAFAADTSTIPFNVLATYLAGAQLGLLQWWLEKPRTHTPETIAQTFHRLQRAALREALGFHGGSNEG